MSETQENTGSNEIEINSLGGSSFSFFSNRSYDVGNVSMETLQDYIKYPMIYNAILRELSIQAYNANGLYANAVDTRVALPLLSYLMINRNPESKSKAKVKKKKKKIDLDMKLLNHEKTTRDILRRLNIDGMYVGILRDTKASNKKIDTTQGVTSLTDRIEGLSLDDNFMIQPLDLDHCKILGYQNSICVAGFDLMYFQQYSNGGLLNEIKNYPKSFLSAYMAYKKDANKRWFILDPRTTIALTSRANIDEPYGRPYGLQSLADIRMQTDYTNSQYKLVQELASSIYYLVLPQGKEPGSCSLTKVQQDALIEAFRSAVRVNTSSSIAKISTLSLPPNTSISKVGKDAALLKDTLNDENIKKISTSLGFASAILNGSSDGSSSFAGLQVNLDVISAQVFQLLSDISSEYTRVLNEYENTSPENYIDISYLKLSYLNKDKVYENMKDLFMTAGGSRMYMIAATGVNPYDYLSVCDEEREDDLDSLYQPHITSYTASESGDKPNPDGNLGGRPAKDEKDMTDSGLKTKNTGANNVVKPSTK